MTREEFLDHAKSLITGQRAADYGDASVNFERIASAWNWWLKDRLSDKITLSDVGMMMALLKMARLNNNHLHEDSFSDLLGYIALSGEMALHHGVQEEVEGLS